MATRRRRRRRPQPPVLDLRGYAPERAAGRLEDWLERAFRNGVGYGTILCGWGKGALMRAVGEQLDRHPLVVGCRRNGPQYVVEILPRSPDS